MRAPAITSLPPYQMMRTKPTDEMRVARGMYMDLSLAALTLVSKYPPETEANLSSS